ncbi:MAG: hypothetical protein ACUVTL_05680 [Thermoproteota archaeon]
MRRVIGRRRSAHAMSAFVGLDVHAESTYAAIIREDGQIPKRRRMAN